jgi:hypothetical protein
MANEPKTLRGGVAFPELLALLFIGLKLTGKIDWSWWWVLCPLFVVAVVAALEVVIRSLKGGER